MVEETRQTQGYDVQQDTASSSAFSAKKLYEKNKEKHTKIGNSENQRNNDKKPGKCNHCKKPEHWKRECRIFLKEQKERNKSNSGNVLVGVQSKDIEISDNYESFEVQLPVRIGDSKYIMAIGKGNINVQAKIGDKWVDSHLLNVLHVPDLKVNLFSCEACLDKGIKMMTDSDGCIFKKNNRIVAIGVRENKMFSMVLRTRPLRQADQANVAVKNLTLLQWYEMLSHQNVQYVRSYLKHMRIPFTETKNKFFCEACIYGKQHREPFTLSNTKTTKPGQLIHSNICGPMEENSLGGKRYFVIFKDDYSNYTYVYFMSQKSEIKNKFELFLNTVKNQLNISVITLRSDCGLEYKNTEVKVLLDKFGIKHETSVPYTPQQNGKAERSMRTIVETARTMLYSKNLSKTLWAEAVNTVVYTINRTGNTSQERKTPYELWFNKTPDISHLKIFGGEVYAHISKEKRRKWDQKGRKGIFVRYSEETKGYRICFDGREISLSRDVIFKESTSLSTATQVKFINEEEEEEVNSESEVEDEEDNNDDEEKLDDYEQIPIRVEEQTRMTLRDRGKLNKPIRYRDALFSACNDPVTYEDA
ncbi:hypothetical protein QTP88_015548 [Uroleucon formosanum]